MEKSKMEVSQDFVTFFSPGTFVSETTTKPVKGWNVANAKKMAETIKERYGAVPYGFQFSTRGRGPKDLDSKVIKTSPMYWVNVKIETLAQIKRRNRKEDKTLIWNMETNGWDRVVTTVKGWKATYPIGDKDIILE
jgi:hypothetical protein